MRHSRLIVLVLVLAVASLGGCNRNKKKSSMIDAPGTLGNPNPGDASGLSSGLPGDQGAVRPSGGAGLDAGGVLKTVYFDYDKSDVRSDQRAVLDVNKDYLASHPDIKVIIEGNCDERGTAEYNLALGDRRATAVRSYLTMVGIAGDRLATVSKGEENPIDPGKGEDAWAKNRRAEFKFQN